MRFRPTPLGGAVLVEQERHADDRGFFARTYCDDEFAAAGLPTAWPQHNVSHNARAGTLRGMHYNAAPHREAKLVRCVTGAVWDAIVDLRPDSPTHLKWFGVELSSEAGNALYVPEGFAHGFITLQDRTDVFYLMGKKYQGAVARGFRWDDPLVGIVWPAVPVVIADRDRTYPDLDPDRSGRRAMSIDAGAITALIEELYPICRSITGDGLRETLRIIARHIPIELTEVPSGTPVLDWTVPPEWNIRDAYVADADGRRVIDFQRHNLHVVNYSTPVKARMSLAELRPHLHTIPAHPDWIPYRTSYYAESWGFCLTQRQLDAMSDGPYDVVIDSTLAPGHLTYGELVLPGELEDEILISSHVCHPSLADDNLSGIAISTLLAQALAARPRRRHTFRFVYAPGTIGAITWLARNRDRAARIKHGLTLTCLGDEHPFTYKRSVGGRAPIDRAAAHVLSHDGAAHQLIDFFPYGYDERQYGSPGFRLPVGSLMRGRHGMFPEYHTSGDNLTFISGEHLAESASIVGEILDVVDGDRRYRNLQPYGEPQLGKRGLYRAIGGTNIPDLQMAMLWVLNQSDGDTGLLHIAERAGIRFSVIQAAADLLRDHELLAPA